MRPPKCFDASQTKSTWFLFQLWLNDNWSAVLVTLCVVALSGVSKEQVVVSVHVESVSIDLKRSGIRYLQKRKVSTNRKCSDKCTVALKSATFEMRVA